MKELTIEESKQVSAGLLPLILLADFAVGVTAGAALKKLWNKFA
ncbi:hypothetical protein [Thalassotalea sp. PP2-459]|nr:hypothetical protein [Thalassotalea sp. PP2-459]